MGYGNISNNVLCGYGLDSRVNVNGFKRISVLVYAINVV